MSRFSIILIVILLVLVGGAVLLASIDTAVAPVRVEKPVAPNESAAQ